MKTKPLVAYLRVSTERQEKGLGLEVQEQKIRRWSRERGFKIVGWCQDAGVSGANGLEFRRGLPDALAMIIDRRAVGVVVYRLDRLARDQVLQETLLREIERLGGEVFTTVAAEEAFLGDDPDDPTRTLIRQIIGALGQWEKAMITMRLRMGRRRKAENKGFAYGSPPLGLRSVEGILEPDADEQAVLDRIRVLRRGGRSIRAIASALTEEGLKTKRGGSIWHPTVVARLVRRMELLGLQHCQSVISP